MRIRNHSAIFPSPVVFAWLIFVGAAAAALPASDSNLKGKSSCPAPAASAASAPWLASGAEEIQSGCTVYCPYDPYTSCTSYNNWCDLIFGFGTHPTDVIVCDDYQIACPPCPGCMME